MFALRTRARERPLLFAAVVVLLLALALWITLRLLASYPPPLIERIPSKPVVAEPGRGERVDLPIPSEPGGSTENSGRIVPLTGFFDGRSSAPDGLAFMLQDTISGQEPGNKPECEDSDEDLPDSVLKFEGWQQGTYGAIKTWVAVWSCTFQIWKQSTKGDWSDPKTVVRLLKQHFIEMGPPAR